jgi:hypothetical protein
LRKVTVDDLVRQYHDSVRTEWTRTLNVSGLSENFLSQAQATVHHHLSMDKQQLLAEMPEIVMPRCTVCGQYTWAVVLISDDVQLCHECIGVADQLLREVNYGEEEGDDP